MCIRLGTQTEKCRKSTVMILFIMRKFVLFAYKVKTFFAMLYAKVHNLPHCQMEPPASVLVFKAAAAQELPQ